MNSPCLPLLDFFYSFNDLTSINSIIEGYNRTLQKEFIDNYLDVIHDKYLFHKHFAEYMFSLPGEFISLSIK
jgi:hypothetical protein